MFDLKIGAYTVIAKYSNKIFLIVIWLWRNKQLCLNVDEMGLKKLSWTVDSLVTTQCQVPGTDEMPVIKYK